MKTNKSRAIKIGDSLEDSQYYTSDFLGKVQENGGIGGALVDNSLFKVGSTIEIANVDGCIVNYTKDSEDDGHFTLQVPAEMVIEFKQRMVKRRHMFEQSGGLLFGGGDTGSEYNIPKFVELDLVINYGLNIFDNQHEKKLEKVLAERHPYCWINVKKMPKV